MAGFKDHFSKQSAIYREYRPDHPTELMEYLASLAQDHSLAWDCGTGNGQAAIKLVNYFDHVFATDASANQILHATRHPRIEYEVQRAEDVTLPSASVDLITVAVALHWFEFDEFYKQVKRVLKPKGIIAAWTYVLPVIGEDIDPLVSTLHYDMLGPCWLTENRMVEAEYRTIPFPFEELTAPAFFYQREMTSEDFLGYLRSWSAVQRYIDNVSRDPLEEFVADLKYLWGNKTRNVNWKVILRVGVHS